MTGEYANMTQFVTDEDALDVLVTKDYSVPMTQVAVLTDGLQRLALNIAENTPHGPFFAPFFRALGACGPEKDEELHSALVRFLSSDAVNKRTDDDKTLALGIAVA